MRVTQQTVTRWAAAAAAAVLSTSAFAAEPTTRPAQAKPDLTKQKTLYAVGYAHLDTQWRWSYPQVVRQFLRDTLRKNPPLLDKYPHYVFNFTGSYRYMLMKEYYPADYERMKGYIKAGRWFPGGSNVDETDQNVPSAESVVRHVLYGNQYFKREFGVCGTDFMVPDCFGFPYSLPSVLHHCGIQAFHTAKLRWGSAVGIPFNVGQWEGVDGERVLAAFDPTPYDSHVDTDLSTDAHWLQRATANGDKANGKYGPPSKVYADYRYYGTGDRGGAPDAKSVAEVEKSATGDGPLKVVSATTDQMFRDLTPAERAKLPVYKGDLLLTWHSAGSITSQAYMKRWNRKNELLADAAERASTAAHWLGATAYPSEKLYTSWMALLEGQMHDILPGDCLPVCYNYSWNDEILAANGFAAAETDGVGGVAASMDTTGDGVPLVVYNPLGADRTDVVEATVTSPLASKDVTVTGPDGKVCPSQVIGNEAGKLKVLFVAKVPGTSFATFKVKDAADIDAQRPVSPLKVTPDTVENARYKVTVNPAGDVAEVFDKANHRNLISAPIRLGFLHQNPSQFPAWNMDWEDRQHECQEYVGGPATIKVVESGPVRVALEITREARGSKFTQRVQLTAGSDRVEFPTHIDWQATECSLEAVMPLAVSNPNATYDTQVGVTVRGNNTPKKYEVPQQQWLDVTGANDAYGVSVLNDGKYGSDKPDDKTVRLTLLYTPGVRGGYQDEGSQDHGRHEMTYALTGHAGDWRAGHTAAEAARLNQPLVAFQTTAHPGPLGKQFALLSVSNPAVSVQAVKKAEESDEVIVRLKETNNRPAAGVTLTFPSAVLSAREVDGQEAEIGRATVTGGKLVTDVKPFHLKAFAVKLAAPTQAAAAVASTPVALPFDQDVATTVGNLTDGSFDAAGRTYPAEQLPAELVSDGITFKLGPTTDGAKNAVACHGQTVPLPAGAKRVYVLAASSNGDVAAAFKVGDQSTTATVQDWGGYIGQWDNRLWKGHVSELTYGWSNRLDGLVPGYVKRGEVAWHADHRHHPETGNEIWEYCYLFKYGFDVPAGATSLTLPDNANVRVFAVSTATDPHDGATPARPLYDTLGDHVADDAPRAVVVPEASAAGVVPTPAAAHVEAAATAPAAAVEPTYADAVHVALQPPLYYKEGGLHYTTDGSAPTVESPRYESPLFVTQPTTIRARQFDAAGVGGPELTERVDVRDTTPPRVTLAQSLSLSPEVRVTFSEPVTKASAEAAGNYRFDPPLAVSSAQLQGDGRSVLLDLAATPAAGSHLTVSGVRDVSPAGNAVAGASVAVDVIRPAFQVATYTSANGGGPLTQAAPGVPVKAGDPWTVNFLARAERTPGEMVVLAGFGKCKDGDSGLGRYLCLFGGALHYWSCNQDVDSDRQFAGGNKWQMVTATFDGKVLTMFKDGQPIGTGELALADDEATVRLAPPSPWDKKNRFAGEIRDFAVWNAALPAKAVAGLWDAHKSD